MIEIFRAELYKLTRTRVLAGALAAIVVSALVMTTVAFVAAKTGSAEPNRGTTLASLAEAGGATRAFSLGVSFTGFFVFVVFTANWAGEFSLGTFRTLLMKQPQRLALMAGKLAALVLFAGVVLLLAEAAVWAMSLAFAPAKDVSTGNWFTFDALDAAARNYGLAIFGVTAWAFFGMALGLVLRSTPLALAVGIAWAGPFEHLTSNAWHAAGSWYPGLLLESLAVGGTSDASVARAMTLLAMYVAVAATIGALSFSRRDITS